MVGDEPAQKVEYYTSRKSLDEFSQMPSHVPEKDTMIYEHFFSNREDFYFASYNPDANEFYGFRSNEKYPDHDGWDFFNADRMVNQRMLPGSSREDNDGRRLYRDDHWKPTRAVDIPHIRDFLDDNRC